MRAYFLSLAYSITMPNKPNPRTDRRTQEDAADYFSKAYVAIERTYRSDHGFPDIQEYMLAFYNLYMVCRCLRPAALLLISPRSRTDALVHSVCKHFDGRVRMAVLETSRFAHVLVYSTGIVLDSEQLMADLYACMSKYKTRQDAGIATEVDAALRRLLGYRCTKGFPCTSADGRVSNLIVNYTVENPMIRRMQLFGYCCTSAEKRRNAGQIDQLRAQMQESIQDIDGGSSKIEVEFKTLPKRQ